MNRYAMNKQLAIVIAAALLVLLFWLTKAVPQDPAYHHFADTRGLLGVPNFGNVLSNLPFLFAGIWGMLIARRLHATGANFELAPAYLMFFSGVFLTTFGSGYYHLAPSNDTLLWDRMPMTIAFAGLFAAVIGEYRSVALGRRLLPFFFVIGLGSVVYWYWTESQGVGDLRPYAIVQFLPMLAVPAIILVSKRRRDIGRYVWFMIAYYVLAKLLEHFDAFIYDQLAFVSGHSLKHIAASLGPVALAIGLSRRRLRPQ